VYISLKELFKWCEPSLYESIIQYRKSLIEDNDLNQKIDQAEFINNIFYAMIEAIKIDGLNVCKYKGSDNSKIYIVSEKSIRFSVTFTKLCYYVFVVDNLTQRYKSRLIQSIINLLSYLIESPDGNLEINAIYPWLLLYNLLK